MSDVMLHSTDCISGLTKRFALMFTYFYCVLQSEP